MDQLVRDRGQCVPLRTKRDSPQSPSSCLRWKVWPKDTVWCSLRGGSNTAIAPSCWQESSSLAICANSEPLGPSQAPNCMQELWSPLVAEWVLWPLLYSWWQVPRKSCMISMARLRACWGGAREMWIWGRLCLETLGGSGRPSVLLAGCSCLPAFLPSFLLVSPFLPFPSIHIHLPRLSRASYCICWWRRYGFSNPLKAFKPFLTHKCLVSGAVVLKHRWASDPLEN